jgi:hypothetical protein
MSETQTPSPPPVEPPPPIAPPASVPTPPSNPESPARTWNMLCHLSALTGYLGVPFGNLIGPLLVWQIKKHEIPSVEAHGKAALNFQITVTLALFASAAVAVILSFFCVGYLLFPLVGLMALAGIIFPIIAGLKANDGQAYKYPCTIEFLK